MKIAIVGATGVVGKEMLSMLSERKFPVQEIKLFASQRSQGKKIQFNNNQYTVQTLSPGCFKGIQLVFFDASDKVSAEWVMRAAQEGAWVVDNSSEFRLEPGYPLIVPEVNGHLIARRVAASKNVQSFNGSFEKEAQNRVLSGPNCTVVPLTVLLAPLRDEWGLKRVVLATYQSVSGAGSEAILELKGQMFDPKHPSKIFKHPIAANCIPQIGGISEDGFTSEEMKTIQETRKILGIPELPIISTCVRVPTFRGHAEAVFLELEKPFELDQIQASWAQQEGVKVLDDLSESAFPTPLASEGNDWVWVGRLRRDRSIENGIAFWLVSDNLRKGAATNAIQIGEILVSELGWT